MNLMALKINHSEIQNEIKPQIRIIQQFQELRYWE